MATTTISLSYEEIIRAVCAHHMIQAIAKRYPDGYTHNLISDAQHEELCEIIDNAFASCAVRFARRCTLPFEPLTIVFDDSIKLNYEPLRIFFKSAVIAMTLYCIAGVGALPYALNLYDQAKHFLDMIAEPEVHVVNIDLYR